MTISRIDRRHDLPASERVPQTIRNVLSNWGTFVVFAVTNFFLSPFIVHRLGDSMYGIWAIIGSMVGYLGLLDLGVRGAVTRYIARYAALHEVEAAKRLASSALFLFAISSGLVVILSVALTAAAPPFFHLDPEHATKTRLAILAAGGAVAVTLLTGVSGGTLAGLHRFTQLNGLEIGLEVSRVAGILAALSRGGGIVALALIQLGVGLARLTAYSLLARRAFPELRFSMGLVDRATVRLIASFGAYSSLLGASGMIVLYSDSIVIGALLPVSAVTYFAIGANLIEYTRRILSGISQPLTPLASATEAVSEPPAVGLLLRRSSRLSTLLVAPVVVTFILRGGTFIGLWMGEAYRSASGTVLGILALATFTTASHQMLTVTLMGLSRHRILLPLYLGEAVANLGLSLALARPYGIAGVAVGTLLPRLAITVGLEPSIIRKQFGIPPAVYARDAWLRPGLAMIPFAVASLLVEQFWRPASLAVYFAQVLLVLPLAAAGAWYLAMDDEESRWVRDRAKQLSGLLRRALGEA